MQTSWPPSYNRPLERWALHPDISDSNFDYITGYRPEVPGKVRYISFYFGARPSLMYLSDHGRLLLAHFALTIMWGLRKVKDRGKLKKTGPYSGYWMQPLVPFIHIISYSDSKLIAQRRKDPPHHPSPEMTEDERNAIA